jgi:hypothetical protein
VRLLMCEINHRAKNMLSLVQAIASQLKPTRTATSSSRNQYWHPVNCWRGPAAVSRAVRNLLGNDRTFSGCLKMDTRHRQPAGRHRPTSSPGRGSVNIASPPPAGCGADQQESGHPRTVEGREPGKSYTANGERVEEVAHRSNLRQIAEDARIAGQSAVGQTADHDIAGEEPKAGGNRRGGAPRSLIAVHGGQFLRFLIITRKHDDKSTAIRSGARDHHGTFSQTSTSTPPALSIASRRTQPEHVTMFNRISRFSGDRSNNVLHKRRGRGQPATGHDRTTTIRLSDEIEAKIRCRGRAPGGLRAPKRYGASLSLARQRKRQPIRAATLWEVKSDPNPPVDRCRVDLLTL